MSPDLINGLFEFLGSMAVGLSICKVLKDKDVAGISWWQVWFFQLWGFWNLYYYPSLDQPFSFAGGVALAAANTVYLVLLWKYRRKPCSSK